MEDILFEYGMSSPRQCPGCNKVKIHSANPRQPFDMLRTSLREFRNHSRELAEIGGKTASRPDLKNALATAIQAVSTSGPPYSARV